MKSMVIIDDESVVIEAIELMVRRAELDYRIVGTATNGIDGLHLVRSLRPDVVITDIRMPGMDGLSLIEQTTQELPMCVYIVISGYREFEYAHKAISLNVSDYIEKPIDYESVVTALMRADNVMEIRRKAQKVTGLDRSRQIEKTEAQNEAIARVLRYIHENYNADFGLDELSELVGMTPAYLSALFKENTGTSYVKYLTAVRMTNAKRMLQNGEKAMTVAQKVGYNEYNYFCKVFKKQEGVTPTEYRDQYTNR